MRKVIHESRCFKLTSENMRDINKRGKGHRYYRITADDWSIGVDDWDDVRKIVDPKHNIAHRHASSWAFKDLKTAEKKYMMLIMRWS